MNPEIASGRREDIRIPGLAGKVAVLTGAARGIGEVLADGLAAHDVTVICADLDTERVRGTADRINDRYPGRARAEYVDVTDPASHQAVANVAVEAYGGLDFWVNNAGIFPADDGLDIPAGKLQELVRVNVEGVMYGSQVAAASLRPGGSIVNMASMAAEKVRRGHPAYCASKAAVAHLTRCLAVELGDRGIRVNALAPGIIETSMTRWVHETPGKVDEICSTIPLHRLGVPGDLLGPLLLLLSDLGRYVTGHVLTVDGGMSLA